MQNLNFSLQVKSFSLQRSQPQPGHRKSLQSSNRFAMDHLGLGCGPTSDPKGGALRQLRLDKGLDPSLLASQACISLAQLYEIETGHGHLFYSVVLREQTARRVAHLLNADLDELKPRSHERPTGSNVVHIQSAGSPRGSPRHPSVLSASSENPDHLTSKSQPISLALGTPSVETPQQNTEILIGNLVNKKSPVIRGRTILLTAIAIAAGSAAAWALTDTGALNMAESSLQSIISWISSVI